MIKCFFVDVKSIKSNLPRANFVEAELDKLADLILETDGLLRPLILQETGAGKYKVIEGHREYYAAVRAKEKNLAKAEMVNAFVIDASNRKSAIAQLALLSGEPSANVNNETDDSLSLAQVESIVEAKISEQLQPILERLAKHDEILETLTSAKPLLPVVEAKISQQIQPILDRLTKHDEILETLNAKQQELEIVSPVTPPDSDRNKKIKTGEQSDNSPSLISSGKALPKQPDLKVDTPKSTTKSNTRNKTAPTSDIPLIPIPSNEALPKQPEPEVTDPKSTTKSNTRNKTAKTIEPPLPIVTSAEPPQQSEPQLADVKTSKSTTNSKTPSNLLSSIDPTKATNTLKLINTQSQQQLTMSMERSGLKTSVKFIPNLIDYRNSQPDRQIESWEMILDAKYIGLTEAAIKKIIDKLK